MDSKKVMDSDKNHMKENITKKTVKKSRWSIPTTLQPFIKYKARDIF